MKWTEATEQNCPIAKSLAIFGDRWTLLIIRNAFLGMTRFEQFQQNLGLTRHVLSDRLLRLVNEGILVKQAYVDRQQRFEYVLTEKGKALAPMLQAMMQWGVKWTDAQVPEKYRDALTAVNV
ncbi:helix-turn-helix transcriptional regulator [Acinetobacter sp. RF15A]|nr:transcriptional regulator [Acinetobacter sp. RF14B]TSH78034.1 helix-turn-helix transcriptional regulator [Acinetobacter sp. RF15A]TSI20023.1 helix-turn-helix transcriptional regulator [Acinetobacter sp. RF15B]